MVIKNVPNNAVVVGNPAKHYAYVCKCGCKLDTNLKCSACGKKYLANNDGIIELLDDRQGE